MATPQSPKLLFWVQVLVSALPCPERKSLHTRLMVRQLSLKQSMQVRFLCVNQQLFQLTWHTWCAPANWLSHLSFKQEIAGSSPVGTTSMGRLAKRVWATVCKTAALSTECMRGANALLVQFQLDPLWRGRYWQGKLFAKQSWV